MEIKGTELFVKALKEEGIDILFAYPGGMAIDLFDALYDEESIEVILPRHEQGLIHAADGYARSTGKVGVCLVTSGPGATNLVTGIATASYDCVPLVCFTGQVITSLIGKNAFQEVDIVSITKSICKHSITVRDRKDLGRIIKEAFYIAKNGKPGPVIVDFPRDIQLQYGSCEYPSKVNIKEYKANLNTYDVQINKALDILRKARKPVFLVGGGVRIANAGKALTKLAEITGVPVITTIMGKGAMPTNHPLYIGNIGMHGSYASNKAVSECDVLFAIGTRFNDRITGKISEFAKDAVIIHVDIDSSCISKNVIADIAIVADAKGLIEKMLKKAENLDIETWRCKITNWRKNYPINMNKYEGMTPEMIIRKINKVFRNSVVVTDVGQNQLWTTQYLELDENRQMLTSGGLGTMGYGFPAAIGAKLGNPDKEVICISGDGGIQMNIQEMATAVMLEIPLIICIFNNSYLGNVRQWQEMFYNKRYSSTCLRKRKQCTRNCQNVDGNCPKYIPDFIKLAESYDAKGIRVEREEDIEKAFKKAKENINGPTVIEFIIEKQANVFPIVPGRNNLNEMIMDY